jgi:hypothetical protein
MPKHLTFEQLCTEINALAVQKNVAALGCIYISHASWLTLGQPETSSVKIGGVEVGTIQVLVDHKLHRGQARIVEKPDEGPSN